MGKEQCFSSAYSGEVNYWIFTCVHRALKKVFTSNWSYEFDVRYRYYECLHSTLMSFKKGIRIFKILDVMIKKNR